MGGGREKDESKLASLLEDGVGSAVRRAGGWMRCLGADNLSRLRYLDLSRPMAPAHRDQLIYLSAIP